jgi:hypothetical protein
LDGLDSIALTVDLAVEVGEPRLVGSSPLLLAKRIYFLLVPVSLAAVFVGLLTGLFELPL